MFGTNVQLTCVKDVAGIARAKTTIKFHLCGKSSPSTRDGTEFIFNWRTHRELKQEYPGSGKETGKKKTVSRFTYVLPYSSFRLICAVRPPLSNSAAGFGPPPRDSNLVR
jgi:hypothetical protein